MPVVLHHDPRPRDRTMTRTPRRILLRAVLAACGPLLAAPALAGAASVPVRLQSVLLAKIVMFDRAFQRRCGRTARIIILHRGGDSELTARDLALVFREKAELGGLPATVEVHGWTSAAEVLALVRASPTAVAYLCTGLELEAPLIAAALDGISVLTVGATSAMAERGACVGFDLEEGRPKIYVNLRVAKRQNVELSSALLRLVKIV